MTDLASSYVFALTGDVNTVMDWRVIHDTDKSVKGRNFRATLAEARSTLEEYNRAGWGVFVCINAMDGHGRELAHVHHIRTHVVDLDDPLTSRMNYDRAVSSYPQPHIAVQTSPDKFHVYWLVEPYTGNDFYTLHQRKFAQFYGGDKMIVDAARVLRVPGFYHMKNPTAPFMVSCWGLSALPRYTASDIESALQYVNVFDTLQTRFPLGEKEMQAPSYDWLAFALTLVDPNEMSRGEWLSFSAAIKQAGWNLTDDNTLMDLWQRWCLKYHANDVGENIKLWQSIRDTQVGWPTIMNRTSVKAYMQFGFKEAPQIGGVVQLAEQVPQHYVAGSTPAIPTTTIGQPRTFGEILSEEDCAEWFKDCYFIEREGKIFTPTGRYMNSTQFNGRYGGKFFIITSTGKTTDEAWKAALRSTCWTIPKVDHVRFMPGEAPFAIVEDEMGRKGLNSYIPAKVTHRAGDVSLWLDHVARIIPDPADRKIWFDYMAHAVKYPGYKIQFAPLLQSAEGIGKTVFAEVMQHAVGLAYCYSPKASDLISSGSKFNAWMRGKLVIVVNEIKVDERRELIEILKPMITDRRIEVQSKGVDQEMEDNTANWILFSNFKDAIPINKNGRRYAIFYSALQSEQDILNAGMDKAYFDRLFEWLRKEGGLEFITHWLKNYPIEEGEIPVRAPRTASYEEALSISRSPLEVVIQDNIEDGTCGFIGGFVSVQAVLNKARGVGVRNPTARSVQTVLEQMGYHMIGKTQYPIAQEDINNRSIIYAREAGVDVGWYNQAQGYR